MTVAAMAWVFRQTLPPVPKMVLLTLADQTDDQTGRVCYGHTDIDHLAAKTSVSKRGLYRHISALVRNGYLVRESGAKERQPNKYWLIFDRELAPWQWYGAEEEHEQEHNAEEDVPISDPQELVGDSANLAPMESEVEPVDNSPPPCAKDDTPRVPYVAHKESANQSTKESPQSLGKVSGFSKKAQALDIAKAIHEREQAKPAQYFVIEYSRAWDAWAAEMQRRTGLQSWHLTTVRTLSDGKKQRGWYFPSLFPPPKPAAPPGLAEGELSDEDAQALMGM